MDKFGHQSIYGIFLEKNGRRSGLKLLNNYYGCMLVIGEDEKHGASFHHRLRVKHHQASIKNPPATHFNL